VSQGRTPVADDSKQILLLQAPPRPLEVKKRAGRPSKKTDEIIEKLLELAKKGRTVEQMAEILDIHSTTIFNWMNEDKQLFWSFNEYRQFADEQVEKALYEKATGFKRKVEKPLLTKTGSLVIAEINEQFPPDTEAAKFWLKNRQAQKWKDKTEVEAMVGTININIEKEDLDL
jgi:hypothetical protein